MWKLTLFFPFFFKEKLVRVTACIMTFLVFVLLPLVFGFLIQLLLLFPSVFPFLRLGFYICRFILSIFVLPLLSGTTFLVFWSSSPNIISSLFPFFASLRLVCVLAVFRVTEPSVCTLWIFLLVCKSQSYVSFVLTRNLCPQTHPVLGLERFLQLLVFSIWNYKYESSIPYECSIEITTLCLWLILGTSRRQKLCDWGLHLVDLEQAAHFSVVALCCIQQGVYEIPIECAGCSMQQWLFCSLLRATTLYTELGSSLYLKQIGSQVHRNTRLSFCLSGISWHNLSFILFSFLLLPVLAWALLLVSPITKRPLCCFCGLRTMKITSNTPNPARQSLGTDSPKRL